VPDFLKNSLQGKGVSGFPQERSYRFGLVPGRAGIDLPVSLSQAESMGHGGRMGVSGMN
jgi:hypothetical protein